MSAFRLVRDDTAGPAALGLLTPPGRRTLLIVRPRALAWDLLVVHSSRQTGPTTAFRDFGREEAEAAGEGLYQALQRWAAGGPGRVEPVPASEGGGYLVRAEVGIFPLLACPREPGRPYRPLTFPRVEEARQAADALRGVLCPPPGAGQEVYFNRRNFSR
jgi:hypothetical protein